MIGDQPSKLDQKLILYFTGIITVMFLLVGTFVLFQIIKVQTNQEILLHTVDQDIKSIKATIDKKTVNSTIELSGEHTKIWKELQSLQTTK